MDFLKKHYEKVVLGVVLLGLAVAVAFLPFKIASEKQKLEEMRNQLIHAPVKPLTNLDLSLPDKVLKQAAAPAVVDFSRPHRLFNPTPWQKAADGRLIKVTDANIGPNALVITKLTPLYLNLSLDRVTVTDSGVGCMIGWENEAEPNPRDRRHNQKYCKVGDKNEIFTVREIKPALDNPTNVTVVLELNDTQKTVDLTQGQPFRRIDGYTVDLEYPPEPIPLSKGKGLRVGDSLTFNGETYNIVAISGNEVVLSAQSNSKKWTVKYVARAAP